MLAQQGLTGIYAVLQSEIAIMWTRARPIY